MSLWLSISEELVNRNSTGLSVLRKTTDFQHSESPNIFGNRLSGRLDLLLRTRRYAEI